MNNVIRTEGLIINDTRSLVKSEMLRQIVRLGRTTPDTWERAVFHAFTGQRREDVDWGFEDNQAGYYAWVRSFDRLVEELLEDGQVRLDERDRERTFVAVELDPPLVFNHLAYVAN